MHPLPPNAATIGDLYLDVTTSPDELAVLVLTARNLAGPTLPHHVERAALLVGLRGPHAITMTAGDGADAPVPVNGVNGYGRVRFLYLAPDERFPCPQHGDDKGELHPVSALLALLASAAGA